MKRTTLIILALLLLLGVGGYFGFQAYKRNSTSGNAQSLAAAEQADADRRKAEAAAAEAEAARLASEKARKDAEAVAAAELERRRAAEIAEAARLASEREQAAAAAADQERAAKAAAELQANARRASELRAQETAAAEQARLAALAKLAAAEQEKQEAAAREAARLAALKAQQEREAALAAIKPDLIDRSVLPPDYKRREHYYMQVELQNSDAIAEAEAAKAALAAGTTNKPPTRFTRPLFAPPKTRR